MPSKEDLIPISMIIVDGESLVEASGNQCIGSCVDSCYSGCHCHDDCMD